MPMNRSVQVIFLLIATVFELVLVFASTFYLPWHSYSFLFVASSAVLSIAAIMLYLLIFGKVMP